MVNQNDLIKKTKSNDLIKMGMSKLTISQIRHLSLLDHFLLVVLEKKVVNSCSGIHNMQRIIFTFT